MNVHVHSSPLPVISEIPFALHVFVPSAGFDFADRLGKVGLKCQRTWSVESCEKAFLGRTRLAIRNTLTLAPSFSMTSAADRVEVGPVPLHQLTSLFLCSSQSLSLIPVLRFLRSLPEILILRGYPSRAIQNSNIRPPLVPATLVLATLE